MAVAARATSAAPTFFEPLLVRGIGGDPRRYSLADGGLYANNPAMCAFVEARVLHGEARRFTVLSLGTGVHTRPIRHEDAKGWGLISWARPIPSVVFDGVADTVEFQLQQLIGALPGAPTCGSSPSWSSGTTTWTTPRRATSPT